MAPTFQTRRYEGDFAILTEKQPFPSLKPVIPSGFKDKNLVLTVSCATVWEGRDKVEVNRFLAFGCGSTA